MIILSKLPPFQVSLSLLTHTQEGAVILKSQTRWGTSLSSFSTNLVSIWNWVNIWMFVVCWWYTNVHISGKVPRWQYKDNVVLRLNILTYLHIYWVNIWMFVCWWFTNVHILGKVDKMKITLIYKRTDKLNYRNLSCKWRSYT